MPSGRPVVYYWHTTLAGRPDQVGQWSCVHPPTDEASTSSSTSSQSTSVTTARSSVVADTVEHKQPSWVCLQIMSLNVFKQLTLLNTVCWHLVFKQSLLFAFFSNLWLFAVKWPLKRPSHFL